MKPFGHIGKAPLYVFERHSDAIIPWAAARRSLPGPPFLLTFDRHTDTMEPFLRWAHRVAPNHADAEKRKTSKTERMAALDWRSETDMDEAARDLWHDEHIRAAMEAGIVSGSFVVAFNTPSLSLRIDGIRYLPNICRHGCEKQPHDNACLREHSDLAIDDAHLTPLFADCADLTAALASSTPMILDIDLDYFRTRKSMFPVSAATFLSLVSRSACVTVATEPGCTSEGALDPEVDSDWVLDNLLAVLADGESGSTGR